MAAVSVETLETLSNSDLREQCKLFGLPNVPVTDTSRKILIRKLRLAMEGPANGEKEKTKRRETIHVISKPAVKEPEPVKVNLDASRSARRTIAATNSSIVVESEPVTKVDRRRSSRYSSTSSEKKPVEAAPVKRKTVILEEDSDDDDLIEAVNTAEKAYKDIAPSRTKAAPSQESRDRRSRSASLQKSPTVTTSYNKEVPPTVHETEESGTDNEILTENVYKYNTNKPFVPTKTERQTYYKPSSVPLNVTTTRYSTLGTSATARQSNLTAATTLSGGLGASNVSRRYTSVTHKYDDDYDDVNREVEIGGGSTPYYSDFTRRLERLKNEQINASGKISREREFSAKREVPLYGTYPRRQTTANVQNDVKGFLVSLDRKYQLKQKIMIIFAVFLLLVLYIFIFH